MIFIDLIRRFQSSFGIGDISYLKEQVIQMIDIMIINSTNDRIYVISFTKSKKFK